MLIFVIALVMATGLYLMWTALTGDKAGQSLLVLARFETSPDEGLTAQEGELAAALAAQAGQKEGGLLSRMSSSTGLPMLEVRKGLLIGVPGALMGGLLAGVIWGWPVMIVVGAVGGATTPLLRLAGEANRQRLAFEEDLAAAVDSLASLITAGLGISSAIKVLANTGPERLQGEFTTIYEEASFCQPCSWPRSADATPSSI